MLFEKNLISATNLIKRNCLMKLVIHTELLFATQKTSFEFYFKFENNFWEIWSSKVICSLYKFRLLYMTNCIWDMYYMLGISKEDGLHFAIENVMLKINTHLENCSWIKFLVKIIFKVKSIKLCSTKNG